MPFSCIYSFSILLRVAETRLTVTPRFYYADERNADGSPALGNIDGPAHGEFFASLSEHAEQGPWQQTFVKGAGYKKF